MRLVPFVAGFVHRARWPAVVALVVELHFFQLGHRFVAERAGGSDGGFLEPLPVAVLFQLRVNHQLVGFSDQEVVGPPLIWDSGEGGGHKLVCNFLGCFGRHLFDDFIDGGS